MPGKSKKSIIKRFKITRNRVLIRRPQHQDHFNAKESGEKKRKKRKEKKLKRGIAKKIIESKVF